MADVKTANLLFELGTEELPPKALKTLSAALTREFVNGLQEAGLEYGEVSAYAAPRRLAVLVLDCATAQPDRDVERRGPALQAAFDAHGRPTRAAEGFARSCSTTVDQLEKIETDKGTWLGYRMHQPGQAAADLLPAIAQQHDSGEVLMLAWMNRSALDETLRTGRVCYWSRSRRSLWRKGESSGQVQQLKELRVDCDGDTLIYMVEPRGPSCHTGAETCFFRRLDADGNLVQDGFEDDSEALRSPPSRSSGVTARLTFTGAEPFTS